MASCIVSVGMAAEVPATVTMTDEKTSTIALYAEVFTTFTMASGVPADVGLPVSAEVSIGWFSAVVNVAVLFSVLCD